MTSEVEIIGQLKSVILEGLSRRAPYAGRSGSGRIFTGSYDWHSSVHAHWALLSMSRVTGDTALQQIILERLSPENLEAERKYLQDEENAKFEVPYGRAWLCLLLAELRRHQGSSDEGATLLRREAGASVAAWLERNEASHELLRCGSHQSWLFAFFLLQASRPGASIQKRLDALRTRVERARPIVKALEGAPILGYDFLHLPAIMALINGEPTQADEAPHLSFGEVDEFNCHQCGANAVRLWPHARIGNSHFRVGMEQMLARPEQWRGDFRLVGHWVPQFLWLGIMIERGELV